MFTSIFRIENVTPHFLTHPPLQPKRIMIEAWNLACLVLRGVVFGPSRRFLICRPWAKIWGRGGSAQGVVKNHKKSFFNFFSFFHFNQLDQGQAWPKYPKLSHNSYFIGDFGVKNPDLGLQSNISNLFFSNKNENYGLILYFLVIAELDRTNRGEKTWKIKKKNSWFFDPLRGSPTPPPYLGSGETYQKSPRWPQDYAPKD